ncbi:MAG TPA: hypothetical protein PLD51_06060, partial [Pontiellaceae bacterium]|nr:hypothetical protein [Pontiellaceae bacterium]
IRRMIRRYPDITLKFRAYFHSVAPLHFRSPSATEDHLVIQRMIGLFISHRSDLNATHLTSMHNRQPAARRLINERLPPVLWSLNTAYSHYGYDFLKAL